MDVPVSQNTVRRIQEMIRTGELKRGAPLPPQRSLSQRLNVSRASLREALSVLGTLGMLKTEPRRGTFVLNEATSASAPSWRFASRYAPHEVYQFRYITEGEAARLASTAQSDEELRQLQESLEAFKAAVRDGDLLASSQLDFAFHRLVMKHSRNRVLTDLYANYGAVLLESQRLPLAHHARLWEPVAEHENIIHAMEKRDPEGARYFMHVHIMRAANRVGVELNETA